jgi:hypothetical protein
MGAVKYFDELWVDKAVVSMDTARSYFTGSKHRVECVGGPVIRWRHAATEGKAAFGPTAACRDCLVSGWQTSAAPA